MKNSYRILNTLLKLVTPALLLACSATTTTTVRPPEEFEEQAFKAMSSFYCEYKRWPENWQEFQEFVTSVGLGETVGADFPSASLESPRAIITTLDYQNMLGSPRKVSFIAPPQCEKAKDPEQVVMCGGRVTFRLPQGFSLMGGVAVKERWRAPPYPDAAWRGQSGGYIIAFRFGEVLVDRGAIADFKETLEAAYETSIPGLKWVQREVVEQNNLPLLLHEFESNSSRGRLATIVLSASFDGKLLSINVVGPVEGRSKVEELARLVTTSLRLN